MNVKVDENLPPSIAGVFAEHGHDAHTVVEEGLAAHPDDAIAGQAKAEGRMLVTLDRGFGDVRTYPPGTHPGILVLRPAEQRIPLMVELVRDFLQRTAIENLAGCNVIVQPNAVRIRRPN